MAVTSHDDLCQFNEKVSILFLVHQDIFSPGQCFKRQIGTASEAKRSFPMGMMQVLGEQDDIQMIKKGLRIDSWLRTSRISVVTMVKFIRFWYDNQTRIKYTM